MQWRGKKLVLCILAVFIKLCVIRRVFKTMNTRCDDRVKSARGKRAYGFEDQYWKTELIKNLQEIVSSLIEIRAGALDDSTAKIIDGKYDYFQKLLLKMDDYKRKRSDDTLQKKKRQRNLDVYSCGHSPKKADNKYDISLQQTNCSRLPLQKLVTIILDYPCNKHPKCSPKTIVDRITQRHYDMPVHVVHNKDIVARNITRAKAINDLAIKITTPFVYIAPYMTTYDEHVSLERLIDVLTLVNGVVAVGGAIKEAVNGTWTHGCIHFTLNNYTLHYEEGYKESFDSCLKCDFLRGPFLARTQILQQFAFRENFKDGFYEDWFLRIRADRLGNWKPGKKENIQRTKWPKLGLVMSCPDVMSTLKFPDALDTNWVDFARAWNIKRLINENGMVKWCGCRRGVKHRRTKCPIGEGMSVPPCCLENLADAVKFVMRICEETGIACELQEGTLLGAVKLQKVLPWERDADIAFLAKDVKKLNGLREIFKSRGYNLRRTAASCVNGNCTDGKFIVSADGWNIELNGLEKLDSHQNLRHGQPTTKIQFAGQMVNVPTNPGRTAKERYGKEIYKHAEHWMSSGMKSGWEQYSPGRFQKCEITGHHGCLNQYQADGSFQFNARSVINNRGET